MLKVIDAN